MARSISSSRIEHIECDRDREHALETIEKLRDADVDSEDGRYRDVLLQLVAQYEAKGRPYDRR